MIWPVRGEGRAMSKFRAISMFCDVNSMLCDCEKWRVHLADIGPKVMKLAITIYRLTDDRVLRTTSLM